MVAMTASSFALGLLVAGVTATPATQILKRDSGVNCERGEDPDCVSWYTTGSAQCRSGYERTNLEASGDPLGSYCERSCNNSEREECLGEKCTFYSGQCSLYPGNTICGKAIKTCKSAMRMPKQYCNQSHLGFAVKYNDADGTCNVDENPNPDLHKLIFYFGPRPNVDLHLYMRCDPLTTASAREVQQKVFEGQGRQDCRETPNESAYEWHWTCDYRKPTWVGFIKKARAACDAAMGPGEEKPVFYSATG